MSKIGQSLIDKPCCEYCGNIIVSKDENEHLCNECIKYRREEK